MEEDWCELKSVPQGNIFFSEFGATFEIICSDMP